jgi:ketosteroid isomerase-like protein
VSDANVDIVRTVFEAWNNADLDSVTDLLSEDIQWREIGGRPERQATSGRENLREGLESLFETWQYYRLEPEEIQDVGDRVVAVLREVARGRSSGLEVEGRWGYVITVREGRLTRVEAYRDPRDARAAVGLEDR